MENMNNTNMRKGFTMIELIFVIVIIGILAAVAIPKLAATRDDAKITAIAGNGRTALGDMKSKYTGLAQKGYKIAKVVDITDVPFTVGDCTTPLTNGTNIAGSTLDLCDSEGNICLEFITDANVSQVTVNAKTNTSNVCKGVSKLKAVQAIAGYAVGTAKVHPLAASEVNRD